MVRVPRGAAVAGALAAVGLALPVALGPATPAAADYASQCSSPDRTLSGGGRDSFSVQAGETLRLRDGTFSGGVDAFPAGSTLCVAATAELAPAYLNNAAGALVVSAGGEVDLKGVAVATGFSLDNEGSVTAQNLNINGAALIHNAAGATFEVGGGFSPAAGTILNEGTMSLEGSSGFNGPVTVLNRDELTVRGGLTVDGVLINAGIVDVTGKLTVNGSGEFLNACVVSAGGDLGNNGPRSVNAGTVVAGGAFTNNGTWRQTTSGATGADSLANDGTVSGFGGYRFAGTTRTQGTFSGSSAGNPIVVDDRTPPTPPQIFDTQSGTVSNVVTGTVEPPSIDDTGRPGCVASINPDGTADVEATKSAPAQVDPGTTITFTVTVTNHGDAQATGVVVTDDLPANLQAPISASDGGTVSGGTVTWSLGSLAAGATRTLTVTGTAPASGTLVNTVHSTATSVDPDETNNDGSAAAATSTTEVETPDPPPPPPTAPDYVRTTYTWLPVVDQVPGSDETLRYSVVTEPTDGSLITLGSGGIVYVPDRDFTGVDSFDYTVCDNATPQQCSDGTVTINVLPIARQDLAETAEGTAVEIPVLDNDSAGAPVVSTGGGPAHGTVSIGADDEITYTPDTGFTGEDTFTYTICSPTEPTFCSTAEVTVTVLADNHPPVLDDELLVTETDDPVGTRLAGSDPDDDGLSYGLGSGPGHGSVTVGAGGRVVYTPDEGYAGHDSFTVIVCDDGDPQLCADATVRVRVYPVAVDDEATTDEGTSVRIPVVDNDAGRHQDPAIGREPGHGSVRVSGDRIVYTPDAGFTGTDTFTYRLCSPAPRPLCRTATVTVTVGDTDGAGAGGSGSGSDSGSASGSGSGLPAAGGPRLGVGLAGLLLMAGGGALLVVRRRRGRSGPSALPGPPPAA